MRSNFTLVVLIFVHVFFSCFSILERVEYLGIEVMTKDTRVFCRKEREKNRKMQVVKIVRCRTFGSCQDETFEIWRVCYCCFVSLQKVKGVKED